MLSEIVRFEWRVHTRQPSFIAASALFFLTGFALTASGFGPQNIAITSSFIVTEALVRVARRALRGPYDVAIAAAAFAAIFFLDAPFPLIIAGAALIGLLLALASPNEIGIYRTPLSGIGETGDICARRRQDQRAPPAGLEDAPLVPKIE